MTHFPSCEYSVGIFLPVSCDLKVRSPHGIACSETIEDDSCPTLSSQALRKKHIELPRREQDVSPEQ